MFYNFFTFVCFQWTKAAAGYVSTITSAANLFLYSCRKIIGRAGLRFPKWLMKPP